MARFHPFFQKIALPCVAAAFHIYCGYNVTGRENIPAGGCVICPNHSDVIDPPMVAAAIGNRYPIRVMAKKELFGGGFFDSLITWLGAFPVDRSRADITAIKTALKAVKDGKKLLIFPQGTRNAGENSAKEGAAMLALKTKAPIVPVYITENKGFRTHARVIIGNPFQPDPQQKDYAALSEEILHRIYALRPEASK
jgi:1-acyl-sn-glycerol-3-phosphate acyltransferase